MNHKGLTQSGLSPDTLQAIQTVLAQFASIESAVLYGSRAKGTYKPGSDIDITLHTTVNAPDNLLVRVMGALDDLAVPYSFDVSLFCYIDTPSLIEHIQRVGVELFNAQHYQQQRVEIKRQKTQAQQTEDRHLSDTSLQRTQSEAQLEEALIIRLTGLGYERVTIANSQDLTANLKKQLEVHNNNITLSEGEFSKVLNHLDKGNVFQRAKTLRDRFQLTRDDGSNIHIEFMNTLQWCKNQYQVTHQVTQEGLHQNRYDVTLLINGLPLVQIELKRRGIELKEAFNQINRYQRHSFWAESGLFNYVQLFVISNGVNTKYYANNRKQEFKQTFYWAEENNSLITQLDDFADVFLEKCHISKMISKYIVLHESDKILMVLRPYQYYAVEAIEQRVKTGHKNGYIWHTTGSGKTLTSFKAAQILKELPKVHKVVFVVDRADLDYQTTREFNYFSEGSVDGTDNTKALVEQLAGTAGLIVTTIQKLNTAISKKRHEGAMSSLRDQRVVFIFDECHRTQFGETHKRIVNFFTQAQLFGFTGTPIFKENASVNDNGKRTTKDLFEECLHKYLITNAIADENVLKFAVEYWGKLKRKDGSLIDEQVHSINRKEFFENDDRINGIVDWIIANHSRKTHNKQFSAMMCVGSKDALVKYYEAFKAKKAQGLHDLRVVTIFTYGPNEDDADANGELDDPNFDIKVDEPQHKHSRDKLEEYVADYNRLYGVKQSVKDSKAFYTYYKDIAKRMKERDKANFDDKDRADILLVVNMFLTGFDAKKLNTLYVDKNLKQHGLIQAYSRTNRIFGELKSQGNVVCFRNLKDNTDEAIKLFCDNSPNESILMESYEFYVEQFDQGLSHLRMLAETPDDVNDLLSEDAQAAFVTAFRALMRHHNKLKSFSEFSWDDLGLSAQDFEDFKSKYLDINQRAKQGDGASILEELDFELELIQRDEVNVAYILQLLGDIQQKRQANSSKTNDAKKANDDAMQAIVNMLDTEVQLRSKRHLIEQFMQEYMPHLAPEQDLQEVFVGFWYKEKRNAVHQLCEREGLDKDAVYRMMDEYHFTGKDPLREQVFSALSYQPKLLERKAIYTRVLKDFKEIIHQYEDDTGSLGLGGEVKEDSPEYNTLSSLAHRIGDRVIYFSDQVQHSHQAIEVARFTLSLETPYKQSLASLSAYSAGSELLARGVVNDDILTDYVSLTADFEQQLASDGFDFCQSGDQQLQGLLWSLSEVREGSTVYEFILNAWGYSLAIGGPIVGFLMAYPKAADGLERIKADIQKRFPSKKKNHQPMIVSKDVEAELAKLKRDREL